MATLSFEELQSAADAFVSQFLGHTNWQLWYKLKEEQGFCSNHEFTSWMLAITEEHIVKNFTREMPADDLPPVVMDGNKETRYFSNASSPQFPQSTSYNVDVSSYNCKLEVVDCDGDSATSKPCEYDLSDDCHSFDVCGYNETPDSDQATMCTEQHQSDFSASADPCGLMRALPTTMWGPMGRHSRKMLDTANSGELYKCKYCGRTFKDRGNMYRHVNTTHLRKREHVCPSCGKFFSRSDSLKTHRIKCTERRYHTNAILQV